MQLGLALRVEYGVGHPATRLLLYKCLPASLVALVAGLARWRCEALGTAQPAAPCPRFRRAPGMAAAESLGRGVALEAVGWDNSVLRRYAEQEAPDEVCRKDDQGGNLGAPHARALL